ncbi:MAG: D-alanyl-D-alanine carboxypeptidase/D-alanyl-D-alanine-endopeptidase, partial [Actinobacteria bacterium]|nr:D-alanyl-D-alanine carboxypeptidase/D-alanyl-D-alanine-endopeptidase [Actinomycetota bacterium]
ATAVATGRLRAAVDRVLADPELGNGRSDECLVVSRSGVSLIDHDGGRQLTPASTLKLLTGAAALRKLGPDSRVKTRAVGAAAPAGGVLAGNLWLVGAGDPLLGTAEYEASFKDQPRLFTDLGALADGVVTAGVRAIAGSVVGDESRYDAQRSVPTWKPVYAADGDVGPLSALAVNDSLVAWKPRPVASAAPATSAAAAFSALLRARGVDVTGDATEGRAPPDAHVLADVTSLPLRQIVGEMLVHSDNETAELLTKELGKRFASSGTTEAGVRVIRNTLAEMGLDVGAVATSDGSGLDPGARVSCAVLTALLTGPARSELLASGLAVAGRTGTMFDRFTNNPAAGRLKAKTGALAGVVGLAGIVEPATPGTVPLTFAFLANSLPAPSEARGRRIQERLGAALAVFPEGPGADDLKP